MRPIPALHHLTLNHNPDEEIDLTPLHKTIYRVIRRLGMRVQNVEHCGRVLPIHMLVGENVVMASKILVRRLHDRPHEEWIPDVTVVRRMMLLAGNDATGTPGPPPLLVDNTSDTTITTKKKENMVIATYVLRLVCLWVGPMMKLESRSLPFRFVCRPFVNTQQEE